MRCLECGAENAEATEVCARCGAPVSFQPPPADPEFAPQAGRSGASWRAWAALGVTAALVVAVGLAAALARPGSSPSAGPPTGPLTAYQLRTGECLQDPDQGISNYNQLSGTFTAVACTQSHDVEVVLAADAWPRSLAYPGDQSVYDDGIVRCDRALTAYAGIDNSQSEFGTEPSIPDHDSWRDGDRWLVCFAATGGAVDHSIRRNRR